ncbi:DMT family transporter [Bacillus sp. REN3]|uniref:DMT family transporter n=1 Tax=Bacillus sp. REN3 TaxID=2802440 RepID=UPI001AED5D82|nr:DMT family transporter [Bacillus sp. REN3]
MNRILILTLVLLSLIWGGSYYFIKILLEDFGPWTIAFLRSSLGLLTISAIMLLTGKEFGLKKIPWLPMTIMALINTAIPWAIIGFSETRLTSSFASVLNATTPLWAIVVGLLFFNSKTDRYKLLGMGTAIFGLVILLGLEPGSVVSVDLLGFFGMILASLFYAIGSYLSKRLSERLSMYQVTFGTLLCCMAGSGGAALATEKITLTGLYNLTTLAAWAGLGILGSGIAYILFYFLVQNGGPEIATMVTYLIPVSGIIWGSTMLNEEIHFSLITGLVFILGGIYLAGKKIPEKTAENLKVSS